jgi:hypothetical protein
MSEHTFLPSHANEAKADVLPSPRSVLQRKCACGNHSDGECSECKKEKDSMQRKAVRGGAFTVPAATHEVVSSPGHPLDSQTRNRMERHFQRDFSHVRVHHDAQAAASAEAVHASAYTVGSHVVFGSGRYAPASRPGQELIAHELAHTVQQQIGHSGDHGTAEREADRAAHSIRTGTPVQISSAGAPDPVQRQQPPAQDVERERIIGVSKQTSRDTGIRGAAIVWRMLTRYYPEYVKKISKTSYDEAEPALRVQVKEITVQGKKTQSASITYGKAFVETTSEDTLRERIKQLGLALEQLLKPDTDPNSPRPDLIYGVLHRKFPSKRPRFAGTSYDANLPGGLLTEFKSGSTTVGKATTSWSSPTIYYGKAFAALPDADQEAKLGEELKKIDIWSVENGRLVKADLDDPEITLRIRGLSSAKLTELRDKVTDPDVKKYVGSLLTIATPLEMGLEPQSSGSAKVVIGNLTVVVLPDKSDPKLDRPITEFDAATGLPGVRGGSSDRKKTTTLTVPPAATITISTTWAKGLKADTISGYGRGTTDADKAAGAKTLRVHEGSHGLEYIRLIAAANAKAPYPPPFTGKVGDDWAATKSKIGAYNAARQAFLDELGKGKPAAIQAVDCVGITIDEFDKGKNRKQVCP